MPIYTVHNEDKSFLEELPVSFGTANLAQAEERFKESAPARLYRILAAEFQVGPVAEGESPLISQKEALDIAEQFNVEVDVPTYGITRPKLDLIIDRKKDQAKLSMIASMGPQDAISKLGYFTTRLGVDFSDPFNIVTAFIPIYGQARYTAMLANAAKPFSKAVVRAKVGIIEGGIGNALLEPLNYSLAQIEQDDYTITDSLENIVFGSIIGGGLHMGVGALGDAFLKKGSINVAEPIDANGILVNSIDPKIRASAIQAAINQSFNGYIPDVEHLLSFDRNYRSLKGRLLDTTTKIDPFKPQKVFTQFPKNVTLAEVDAKLASQQFFSELPSFDPPQTLASGEAIKGDITVFSSVDEATKFQDKVFRRTGDKLAISRTPDGNYTLLREFNDKPLRSEAGEILAFKTERQALKATEAVTNLKGRNLTPVPFISDGKKVFTLVENANPDFVTSAKARPELVQFGVDKKTTKEFIPPAESTDVQMARVQQAARNQVALQYYRFANPEYSAQVDEIVKVVRQMADKPADFTTAKNEADELSVSVMELGKLRNIEMDEAERLALEAADKEIAEMDNFTKAIDTAFNCTIKRDV